VRAGCTSIALTGADLTAVKEGITAATVLWHTFNLKAIKRALAPAAAVLER